MLLKDEIKKVQEAMLPQIPEEVLKLLFSKTEELINSGIAERTLNAGDEIPQINLPNAVGKTIDVNSMLKDGPVVISFYRGAWCPYCNLELNALQQILPEIKSLDAQLIAISPNTPDNSISSIEKHGLEFEVLTDAGNKIAKEFRLVFNLAEDLRPIYQQFNFDITNYNGDESWELPIPATYIVNTDGKIVHSFVNADYTQRMEPTEIIRKLKELTVQKQQAIN
ncbi:MAG: AhpC/TSA family protein [Bacteroidetes bacterium]|nr:AhpC/TSA family protein [Bacteroidota bacterium]MCH7722632.1 AhpC/TSA family protein [Bacteroidota bacterium]MCH7770103.1 AhpC/TSA family protein [Bacteroidota bacterium]